MVVAAALCLTIANVLLSFARRPHLTNPKGVTSVSSVRVTIRWLCNISS